MRRILFATSHPYLDDTNGAAVASRAMMESLGRSGFAVEALSGMGLDANQQANPAAWLTARGIAHEEFAVGAWTVGASGILGDRPHHFRLDFGGVPVTLCPGLGIKPHRTPKSTTEYTEHTEQERQSRSVVPLPPPAAFFRVFRVFRGQALRTERGR